MCCISQIAKQYEAGGAACLSVLTDGRYFQGSFNFLREIREAGVSCPLLCKEFIVEAYQLYKARACACGLCTMSLLWLCMPPYLHKAIGDNCSHLICRCDRNGADAVLLIASVLPNKDLSLMLKVASTVGLQCLIEVRCWHRHAACQLSLLRVAQKPCSCCIPSP